MGEISFKLKRIRNTESSSKEHKIVRNIRKQVFNCAHETLLGCKELNSFTTLTQSYRKLFRGQQWAEVTVPLNCVVDGTVPVKSLASNSHPNFSLYHCIKTLHLLLSGFRQYIL